MNKYLEKIASYQEEGSTFSDRGKVYDLNKIFKSTEKGKIRNISLKKLEWMDSYIDSVDENRVQAANTKVPILVTYSKGRHIVLDGQHRYLKAKKSNINTLPYKEVNKAMLQSAFIRTRE